MSSKSKYIHKIFYSLIFCLFVCALAVGCNYHLLSEKPLIGRKYKKISIPIFDNQTLEPGIEEVITQAVVNEFIMDPRMKVEYSKNSDCIMRGVVTSYWTNQAVSFDTLSRIAEYRLTLSIDAKILDTKNNAVLWETENLTVTSDYPVPQQLTEIKNAEERALRLAAAKIGKNIIRIMEKF